MVMRRLRQVQFGRRSGRGDHRVVWRLVAWLAIAVFALCGAAACSRETVHRALVFLYDGVPALDGGVDTAAADLGRGVRSSGALPSARGSARTEVRGSSVVYSHPAYRDSRCGGCHVGSGGGLLRSVREGLCRSCHPENPPRKKFTHGPVAIEGCMACHAYHQSRYEKILIADAQTLCYGCHETGALSTDEHHATIEIERCIDCHDPHGGDERYFLLPGAVRDGAP